MTKPAATPAVTEVITRAKKSPSAYLAEPMTENQEQFREFCLAAAAEAGLTPKTAAASEAFALGVKAAGLYSRFQASKREAPEVEVIPEPEPAKPAIKAARTRKSA